MKVATVVTGNPERREQALRDHPGVRVVPKADDLWPLADEHDFVVIAAPNDAHVALARRALDAGLAVVVDKPLAPSAAEGAALVEHARASGTLLTVFHNRRWDSDYRTLRKLIAEGSSVTCSATNRASSAGGRTRAPMHGARPRDRRRAAASCSTSAATSSTRRSSCSGP